MYLPDDRFVTAVAFVVGYNAALDGVPLAGFQDFVANEIRGHRSPLHWSVLVASTADPRFIETNLSLNDIPLDAQIALTDMLVDLLESYHESTKVPPPPPG
jgi:hypothetical protein